MNPTKPTDIPAAAVPKAAPMLTVNDLKQWAYCARIPYFRHVMPVKTAPTYSMERGRQIEPAIQAMEKRRSLRRYGLERGERRFQVWLQSPQLGLAGRADLLIVTSDACYPVDFKNSEGGVYYNHRIQLAAYAMMAEEMLERPAPTGFIFLVPMRRLVAVPLGEKERSAVERAVREIGRMVEREALPPATSARSRCVGCEFRNYCGDIW